MFGRRIQNKAADLIRNKRVEHILDAEVYAEQAVCVSIATITLKRSEYSESYIHHIKRDDDVSLLHIDSMIKDIAAPQTPPSTTEPANQYSVTISGGFTWVHMAGNNTSWVDVSSEIPQVHDCNVDGPPASCAANSLQKASQPASENYG